MKKKDKEKLIKGKVIFVTGGTGSFGNFFVREVIDYKPKKIIIYSRDEDKQSSMRQELDKYMDILKFVIGDIRDRQALYKATRGGIDILVHAAAMKHVPSTEYNVSEAVKTNILGAENVVEVCIENKIERVIAISTDKAVEPINVYGMTKAIQERVFTLANKYPGNNDVVFSTVRYGNVMNSRGSVLKVFKKQLENGGPFTLTDERMTRFNVTLTEAVNLTFRALSNMVGGEVFVPKLNSLKVKDLADIMVEELKPEDKEIKVIGIRPGEKVHETLISPTESLRTIETKEYFIILPEVEIKNTWKKYKNKLPDKKKMFRYASDNQNFLSKKEIKKKLRTEGIL